MGNCLKSGGTSDSARSKSIKASNRESIDLDAVRARTLLKTGYAKDRIAVAPKARRQRPRGAPKKTEEDTSKNLTEASSNNVVQENDVINLADEDGIKKVEGAVKSEEKAENKEVSVSIEKSTEDVVVATESAKTAEDKEISVSIEKSVEDVVVATKDVKTVEDKETSLDLNTEKTPDETCQETCEDLKDDSVDEASEDEHGYDNAPRIITPTEIREPLVDPKTSSRGHSYENVGFDGKQSCAEPVNKTSQNDNGAEDGKELTIEKQSDDCVNTSEDKGKKNSIRASSNSDVETSAAQREESSKNSTDNNDEKVDNKNTADVPEGPQPELLSSGAVQIVLESDES